MSIHIRRSVNEEDIEWYLWKDLTRPREDPKSILTICWTLLRSEKPVAATELYYALMEADPAVAHSAGVQKLGSCLRIDSTIWSWPFMRNSNIVFGRKPGRITKERLQTSAEMVRDENITLSNSQIIETLRIILLM
jgi:hypothetical protein